jgi:hypothetical protein
MKISRHQGEKIVIATGNFITAEIFSEGLTPELKMK